MAEILFQVKDLIKDFRQGKKLVRAVDRVSFEIRRGETLSLVGESGCGKTTCARTLLGAYEPDGGQILWKGKDISSLSGAGRTAFRRENQMIFQDPYSSLDPRMTAAESITEGMKRHFQFSAAERQKRAEELLETIGLNSEFASRFPHELSGGQKQRVGIARALALDPAFLVCDEPVAALDVSIQAQVLNLLMHLQKERELTYLMISHDLTIVRHISDRVAVMYLGSIVELADADLLYDKPLHPYTEALFSAVPEADPESRWLEKRISLKGEIQDSGYASEGCKFAPRCPYAGEICFKSSPPVTDLGSHLVSCWKEG